MVVQGVPVVWVGRDSLLMLTYSVEAWRLMQERMSACCTFSAELRTHTTHYICLKLFHSVSLLFT